MEYTVIRNRKCKYTGTNNNHLLRVNKCTKLLAIALNIQYFLNMLIFIFVSDSGLEELTLVFLN